MPAGWWIAVVMRVGNVADIYSAEVGRGQLWAVGFGCSALLERGGKVGRVQGCGRSHGR